jgi:PAS domain S-box-containing protein
MPAKTKAILIADDRADNRALLVEMLSHRKYRFIEAPSGEEALRLVRKEKPDLVIADVLMPKMDGYEFVRQVRTDPKIAHTTVVFYAAAYLEEEARTLAKACGVRNVIVKPVAPDEVLKVVDTVLKAKAPVETVVPEAELSRQHLDLVRDKLAEKVEELDDLTQKLQREVSDRKAAQLTLERLKRDHELILKSAGEGIYGLDLDGNIIFENPKAAELLGWPVDELLGKAAHATIHHKRPDGTIYPIEDCPIYQSMRDGSTRRVTNDVFWRKNGKSFRVDFVSAPIRDEERRIIGSIVTFKDISEEFLADWRLKLQEQQYRLLFETNPSPMWVFDTRTFQILAVNESACVQYGYSRNEFLKLTLKDLRPLEDVPDLIRAKALTSPQPMSNYSGQFRHVRKDGSLLLVETYSGATIWAGVSATIVTAIDVTERKQAEDRMRSILESALDCVVAMNHEGRITEFNRAAEKTFGYKRSEAIGQPLADLIIPESLREKHQQGLSHYLTTGEGPVLGKRIEISAVRRDGAEFPVELAITRIGSQEPPMFTGFIRDITERKQVEEELRATHKHFRHLLSHTPAVIYSLRIDGESVTPIFVSENIERLLGVSVANASDYKWWRESVHPEDRDRAVSTLANAMAGDGYSMEYRIRHRDGTYHWVEDNNRVVRNEMGAPTQMVGVWADISDRKRTEERLREQADIINRAHDGIMVRDIKDRRITFWNRGAERLYGWNAAEAVGRDVCDLLYEVRDEFLAASKKLMEEGEWNGELRQRCKSGEQIIANCRWTLVPDEKGHPKSVLGINADVTERKKLETHLLRSQRLESIGTLASGVAHDLNNILVPILMAAPVLRGNLPEEERLKFLEIVESSAQRGANIVKQVLTFARGADGDRILLQPIHLLQEITKIVEQTFPRSIGVRTSYPEGLWLIEGDPTQLHQVLLNLCVNARDAMPEGGNLSLVGENFDVDEQYVTMTPGLKPGPHVLISVIDTGTGIPPHVMDKIFDPFFTTKEIGKGSGLGLSTVLGIVKSHGGVVNVYSTAAGTTFRVLLPAAPEAAAPHKREVEVELPQGHGETILIVDDEVAIREVAKAVLSKNGYNVLVADDGPAALAIFSRQSKEIDVVLTDVVMPIMTGLMLTRTLRKMEPSAKVIISSARDADYSDTELNNLGVEGCLTKPYTRETLLRTLDRVLHGNALPP